MVGKRRNSVRFDAAGFTLVEVMIASAILMMFIAGFVGAFIVGMRTLHTANNHYRAMSIARNRVQRARSFDFESLTLLNEDNVRIDQFGNTDPGGRYRRSTMVNTNWPTPNTLRVRVGIRYPVGIGSNLSEPLVVDNLISLRM